MRFAKAVVKHRILILILTVALLVPSAFGMAATRVNYDMLTYLPEDMDTVVGQNELLEDFNKGAFIQLFLHKFLDHACDSKTYLGKLDQKIHR